MYEVLKINEKNGAEMKYSKLRNEIRMKSSDDSNRRHVIKEVADKMFIDKTRRSARMKELSSVIVDLEQDVEEKNLAMGKAKVGKYILEYESLRLDSADYFEIGWPIVMASQVVNPDVYSYNSQSDILGSFYSAIESFGDRVSIGLLEFLDTDIDNEVKFDIIMGDGKISDGFFCSDDKLMIGAAFREMTSFDKDSVNIVEKTRMYVFNGLDREYFNDGGYFYSLSIVRYGMVKDKWELFCDIVRPYILDLMESVVTK